MANEPPENATGEVSRFQEAARAQFANDLPRLLQDHGEQQMAFARHTGELYEVCRCQRLALGEVLLFEIVPSDAEIQVGPMAFD